MELADERGKALQLEEEVDKMRVVCNHLWMELHAEAKVLVEG